MPEKDSVNIKGYCKLYKGDCLEVMKRIPDSKVDMILCDLPYGTTACSWDVIIPFDKLWEQYNRIKKDSYKSEGRPETETKGSRRRDCENEWFADVGLNEGII